MKIYKLQFDVNNFENLVLVHEMSANFYQMFDGRRFGNEWKKIEVKRMEPEKGLPLGDAPGFIIPVFNQKALRTLENIFGNSVEVLPLAFEGEELYGINVVEIADVVDYENSEYKTFRDGKRIMMFKKYSFYTEKLDGINIFKIPDERRRNAFVTEEVYEIIKESGLRGFKLEKVFEG